jgi:hypothetical protein
VVRAVAYNLGICVILLVAVVAGLVLVSRFDVTSDDISAVPEHWPTETPLLLDQEKDTLLVFANPRSCTKSNIEELNRLLAKCDGQVAAHILFFSPACRPAEWLMTDSWRRAKAMRGVGVHIDVDGALASQFGAEVPGEVLLYSPRGELIFGCKMNEAMHADDDEGQAKLISCITRKRTSRSQDALKRSIAEFNVAM